MHSKQYYKDGLYSTIRMDYSTQDSTQRTTYVQRNLRLKDTLGQLYLFFAVRLSSLGGYKCASTGWRNHFGTSSSATVSFVERFITWESPPSEIPLHVQISTTHLEKICFSCLSVTSWLMFPTHTEHLPSTPLTTSPLVMGFSLGRGEG